MNYRTYIKSKEWRKFTEKVKRDRECKCEACGCPHSLHTHHISYNRLYNERPSDVMILCGHCHKIYHEKYPSGTMPWGTRIDVKRNVLNTLRKAGVKVKPRKCYKSDSADWREYEIFGVKTKTVVQTVKGVQAAHKAIRKWNHKYHKGEYYEHFNWRKPEK